MMRQLHQVTRRNPTWVSFGINVRLRVSELRGQTPIIVYQMGKVGSSTVVASLRASGLKSSLYHVHSLTHQGIESGRRMYARIFAGEQRADARRMRHLLASEQLYKRIDNDGHTPRWKIITLVRDPVARNISDFFQVIDYWFPRFDARFENGDLTMDEVITVFIEKYHHEEPLTWFDAELNQALGIDVYATGFAQLKGYEIYRRERIEVLVLKLERLNACAAPAFREFLGLEDVTIVAANVASEKDYHLAYKQFQKDIKLPGDYLDDMYDSKYARHFYTNKEIQSLKAKWRR